MRKATETVAAMVIFLLGVIAPCISVFGRPDVGLGRLRDVTVPMGLRRWGLVQTVGLGLYIPLRGVGCYVGGGFLLDWFILPSLALGTPACRTLERTPPPRERRSGVQRFHGTRAATSFVPISRLVLVPGARRIPPFGVAPLADTFREGIETLGHGLRRATSFVPGPRLVPWHAVRGPSASSRSH